MPGALNPSRRRPIKLRLERRAPSRLQLRRSVFRDGLSLTDGLALVECGHQAALRYGALRGDGTILFGRRAAVMLRGCLHRRAKPDHARKLNYERHQDDMAQTLHQLIILAQIWPFPSGQRGRWQTIDNIDVRGTSDLPLFTTCPLWSAFLPHLW